MSRLYFTLIFLFCSSVSSASVNFNDQIWRDISARSRGETILLPLTMESFGRFMSGREPRNDVEKIFLDFFNEHPQYVGNIKKAYAGLGNLKEEERERLGAFSMVNNCGLSLPFIKILAAINTELSFAELMSSQKDEAFPNTPIALHLYRIDVIEDFDDTMNDSLYVYSVITDGTVTWGDVTDIYPSIDEGQSVMLSANDRVMYPPRGVISKIPNNHLIVDYGIMESDGDDIAALQKLSGDLVSLAAEVLKLTYPEYSPLTEVLARETQTLISTILALNSDDRMAVGTVHLTTENISSLLKEVTSTEFVREHRGKQREFPFNSRWHYRLVFRLIKG